MFGFGLIFRHRDTEREYVRWTIQTALRKSDFECMCAFVGMVLVFCIRCVLMPQYCHRLPGPVVCGVVYVLAAMTWRPMSLEALTARRTVMVLGMRVFTEIFNWQFNRQGLAVPMTGFVAMGVLSGLLPSLMTAFWLRLTFRHHFPFQIAANFAFLFWIAKGRCAHTMASPGASLVVSMADKLDYWAKSIMVAMYGRCSNEPLICPCLHVMVWTRIFVILVAGSYFLWKLEWHSRRAFVRTLAEERRREEGLRIGFEDTTFIKSAHAFLFVVAFAVTWELNYFLVEAINSWGV